MKQFGIQMSEYGDYSEKIFNESESNYLRASLQYSAEHVGLNPYFSFNMAKVCNQEFRTEYAQEKVHQKDTDCAVNVRQGVDKQFRLKRKIRKIETSSLIENSYLKCKKGSPYQTMQLNINFKTIFTRVVQQLSDLKLLTQQQKQLYLQYKNESPSFKSLVKFLNSSQNRQSKPKLKQLVQCSSIISKIQLTTAQMRNKIVMFKFLQTMRAAILNVTFSHKWKNKQR